MFNLDFQCRDLQVVRAKHKDLLEIFERSLKFIDLRSNDDIPFCKLGFASAGTKSDKGPF